ncbi:MAG TPA: AAA family ATPase [Hymenobacter sp.]|jgi:AAA15 family ATPase/GTPase|uniref:AAA family ATPase n=1 Tax=Hymenobacter sp. TaxID=1898978 RepID=UPI002ED7CEA2
MAKSVKQQVETSPYLKQVRTRDYRSIRDAKVDFKPGLNIIIGDNGAGKTNFLSLTSELVNPFSTPIEGANCELVLYFKEDLKVVFKKKDKRKQVSKRNCLFDECFRFALS